MSPLQQSYITEYVRSEVGAQFKAHESYKLVMLAGQKVKPRLALPVDLTNGQTTLPNGKTVPIGISELAAAQGYSWFFRVPETKLPDAGMHRWLQAAVYGDQGLLDLFEVSLILGAGCLAGMLWFAIPKDLKRFRQQKYGRVLRGPNMLTAKGFNDEHEESAVWQWTWTRLQRLTPCVTFPQVERGMFAGKFQFPCSANSYRPSRKGWCHNLTKASFQDDRTEENDADSRAEGGSAHPAHGRHRGRQDSANGTGTATKTAGGAGLGAVIGAIAGGGRGAGIGAASGGAVGLGASALTPGKQIDLKPEALLQFQTDAAFDVSTAAPTTTAASPALTVRPNSGSAGGGSIPDQADPYTFDIVGLKLGMTAKEASAAISSRVPQVSKAAPEPGTAQFTPKARYIQAFSANGPQFKVLVTFTESYPYDPQRPEQLTSIFYTAITPTAADRDRFEQAVLTKYGQPVRYAKGGSASWCNVGTLNSPGVYLCAPNSPNLLLKGSELILGDNSVAQRERAAWNAQTTGAPPL